MREKREILIYYALMHNGDWDKIYNSIVNFKDDIDWNKYDSCPKELKENCITFLDTDIYPKALASIYHPPFVLFYKGDINLIKNTDKIVGIVGTRSPSELGILATEMIVDALPMDYTVVSGMAIGIDSAAHRSAITGKKKTIAVLPCGINEIYPPSSEDIYIELCKNHLVISEYPFEDGFVPSRLPVRNRIIVGLTNRLFLPEAYHKSGSMISVHFALSSGRDVICVPHPFNANTANNRLIKDGAQFVENATDVLEVLRN